MNHLDNWEADLRQRLSAHQTPPPAMGWEKLNEALQQMPAAQPLLRPKRRPLYLRPWFVSTAASVAACMAVGFWLLPGEQLTQQAARDVANVVQQHTADAEPQVSPPALASQKVKQTAEAAQPQKPQTTLSAQTAQSAPAKPALAHYTEPTPAVAYMAPVAQAASVTADTTAAAVANSETPQAVPNEKTEIAQTDRTHRAMKRATAQNRHSTFRRADYYPTSQRARRTPHLSLNALIHPANSKSMSGFMAKNLTPSFAGPQAGQGNHDWDLVVAENMDRDVNTRIHHHVPFQLGLNVAIPLTNRWFLTTGLTYTRLTTDITSGSDASYFITEQRLHYVGIPIQAGYTIFRSRPFNAYATAGFQIEKCVNGKQSTTYNIDNAYRSSSAYHTKLGSGLWQASFNAAAGLQLNVTRHVGIYFEPGVTYYVSDGSSLPSIRHDKPWQFSMQGGLRVSLSGKP